MARKPRAREELSGFNLLKHLTAKIKEPRQIFTS